MPEFSYEQVNLQRLEQVFSAQFLPRGLLPDVLGAVNIAIIDAPSLYLLAASFYISVSFQAS